jgi:membrane protein involved in colicin uptake
MAKYAEDLAEWKRQVEEAAERARKLEEEAARARRAAQEAAAAAAKRADEAKATAARQAKSSATKAKKADSDGKASKAAETKKADAPKKSAGKETDSAESAPATRSSRPDIMKADIGGSNNLMGYAPDRKLPRNKHGANMPDPAADGAPHTQLALKKGRAGTYRQAREWDENGQLVKDIDFTDHGRPENHTNPHQHRYEPNPTGGTPRRGDPEPLDF